MKPEEQDAMQSIADAIRAARAEALEEAAQIADSWRQFKSIFKSILRPLHAIGAGHAAEAIAAAIRKKAREE